ncbi:hypothetical protein [Paenibacillus hamazuiensis]|uniref:hypothetical protein n=1 Tax=Paenibacillus hamazuiensis TaxID=2936508 RepID=UPI00200C079D|nr:hypothetical protein [Paenibacillus hamazuiensis]
MGFLGWLDRRHAARGNAEKMLYERLHGLEKAVEKLSEKTGGHSITIQNLHVHNPSLEQLMFRLDRLDIDELSGALNLGNNFGTRVGKKDSGTKSEERPSAGKEPAVPNEIKKTPAGFKYEIRSKQAGG